MIHLPPSLLFGRKKTPSSDSIFVLASLVCLVDVFCVTLVFFNMFVCVFIFFSMKKGKKYEKYKNGVCMCILVLVCLGWLLKQNFSTLYHL